MNRILLTSLFAAVVGLAAPVASQEEGEKKQSPVKQQMESLDEAIDAVGDFLEKPDGAAPMAQLAAAQKALHESKQHPPRSLEQQPEEERADFLIAYKIAINETIRLVLDLEDAMLKQDWAGATKVVERLKELKKTSHRKFKPRRRRRG